MTVSGIYSLVENDPAPFDVNIVQRSETMFSIAPEEYEKLYHGSKEDMVMLWMKSVKTTNVIKDNIVATMLLGDIELKNIAIPIAANKYRRDNKNESPSVTGAWLHTNMHDK